MILAYMSHQYKQPPKCCVCQREFPATENVVKMAGCEHRLHQACYDVRAHTCAALRCPVCRAEPPPGFVPADGGDDLRAHGADDPEHVEGAVCAPQACTATPHACCMCHRPLFAEEGHLAWFCQRHLVHLACYNRSRPTACPACNAAAHYSQQSDRRMYAANEARVLESVLHGPVSPHAFMLERGSMAAQQQMPPPAAVPPETRLQRLAHAALTLVGHPPRTIEYENVTALFDADLAAGVPALELLARGYGRVDLMASEYRWSEWLRLGYTLADAAVLGATVDDLEKLGFFAHRPVGDVAPLTTPPFELRLADLLHRLFGGGLAAARDSLDAALLLRLGFCEQAARALDMTAADWVAVAAAVPYDALRERFGFTEAYFVDMRYSNALMDKLGYPHVQPEEPPERRRRRPRRTDEQQLGRRR